MTPSPVTSFIRINLLSPANIQKEERNDIIVLAYAVLVLVLVGATVLYGIKFRAHRAIEERIVKAETELTKFETIVRQVESLQATKQVLETKKNVISSLMSGALLYPKFMEDLVAITPSSVGFKNLGTQLTPEGVMNVHADAEALDNYAIADMVSALIVNQNFSNAELGAIATTGTGRAALSSFKLTFSYQKKK